ncbi:MAG TPA: dihydrodipicolinate synthase family protein [Bryobacteraceae bacterium]|jgi:4-hydroxy-2-oxoglutarate aldolase|nr:dihydrodipicolinate synthase family protein [Bryobacteraceae bacterium]
MKLQGIFPALATPFDYQGKLYRTKVFHNVEKLNQVGLAGYTVCGSTGETPLLSSDERLELMRWVKEASAPGKILIAGVGAESVHETVRMAKCAAEIGYDAALVLTPFYYRNQMYRADTQALFFRAVADQSPLPVLLYNIPQVTGYDLPVETIAALSQHPNVAGMKDSSGNMPKLDETLKAVKPGFQVLTGSSASIYEALKLGAAGAILAIANALPYACVTIWEAFRTREHEAAQDWQQRITPLSRLMAAQYGIPALKYAMDLNGYYGGPPRLPFVPVSADVRREIERALDGLRG